MSDSREAGCFSILIIVGHIVAWVGSGILSWKWVAPDSFWKAILFIIAWGIIGYIADMILGFILIGITKLFDN